MKTGILDLSDQGGAAGRVANGRHVRQGTWSAGWRTGSALLLVCETCAARVRRIAWDCYGVAVATIGIISDTHGLVRPEARAALAAVDRIIHAGDFDDRRTMQWLCTMAELTAVRGNCDRGSWASVLPEHALLTVEGIGILVLHDIEHLTFDPKAQGISVVISGHTHQPRKELQDGVLYLNPGSAGPRRYGRPISLAKLHIGPDGVSGEIIILASAGG